MRNSKVKGFTLVELIVVIAIIGILAAILVPSMLGYVRNARISSANSGAKQVHTAAASALTQLGIANWKWTGDGATTGDTTTTTTSTDDFLKIDGSVTAVTFNSGKGPDAAVLDLGSYLGDDFADYGIAFFDQGTFSVSYAGYANTDAGKGKIFAFTSETDISGVLESTQKSDAKDGVIYGIYPAPKITNS